MNVKCLGGLFVLFIKTCTKPIRVTTFLLFVSASLIGCVEADKNDEIVVSDSATAIDLALPRSIVSRRIEIDEYGLALSVNGNDVPMVREGVRWVGETFVPLGTELNVSLAWSARGVPLANLGRNYGSASSSNNISINSSDYTYPDNDGDLLNNISELNADPETNPFDANSPGIPIDPFDTSSISGVYQEILPNGDQFFIFVSDSGTYEILDYLGDSFDQSDDCWFDSNVSSTVRNIGNANYNFDSTFALEGLYFTFLGDESFTLFLESSLDSSILDWDIIDIFYSDPSTFFPSELYCVT